MHFNQFLIFSIISFNISVLAILWVKWQKFGSIIPILLIINLVLLTLGAGKILVYGTMRFDSFTHDISSQVINTNNNIQFTSPGKVILNRIKRFSKKLRGKEPVYTTNQGYQISIDSFGNEKSININKRY